MNSSHNQSRSAFRLAILLLFLGLACACQTTTPDPREGLIRSLKGANVDGYHFATQEDDAQVIASLTNSAVRKLIELDTSTTNVILRYTSVRDKNTNTSRTYKSEIARAGNALTLLVTHVDTGEVVSSEAFPVPESHDKPGTNSSDPTFDSLEDCLRDFDCKERGALQCEANRTCQNQLVGLICCLNNGQCFSVHLIIRPTSFRCLLTELVPDLEGLVLRR